MHIDEIKPDNPQVPFEIPTEAPDEKKPATPSYPESLKKIFRNRHNLEWEIGAGFHSGPQSRRKGYVLALWSVTASAIDALLLIAMSCIFMMAFLKIVKMPITQGLLQDFAVIYVLGSWLYMMTTRFFIGSSIGEAACDIRLGKPQERMSSRYFLKVFLRATLVVATGLVVLPVLSLIFGKDIPGRLSGIQLFSLK